GLRHDALPVHWHETQSPASGRGATSWRPWTCCRSSGLCSAGLIGARTADILAARWPERCRALVSVSGYLIGSPAANQLPCRLRRSLPGGTSITLPPSMGGPATPNTDAT